MTHVPSQEYIARQLEEAEEALDDAGSLLENDHLKSAANRAYYAMFHATMAH